MDAEGSTRSERKHRAILTAGQELFLGKGFDRTTMDEVAARAQVSKQTVYKHFADKEQLFTAIIAAEIAAAEEITRDDVAALGASVEIERDLRRFARQHIRDVVRPEIVTMRRIVIGEADRFPELARSWYEAGPARAHHLLAEQLAVLHDRKVLDVRDPMIAAQQLNWLIIASPLHEAMFGVPIVHDDESMDRVADEAVRVFLAAYGAAG